MTLLQAIGAGLVQGLTEFLPVSSSGHLVLFQELLGISEPSLFLEAVVHAATLFAVAIFFWKKLISLSVREVFLLLIGSIPAGVIGILFADAIESLFSSLLIVGGALAITGLINIATDRMLTKRSQIEKAIDKLTLLAEAKELKKEIPTLKQIFVVGSAQAVAIIPGISRSGSTIATGLFMGLSKDSAFTYSFLLSLPAIGGAFLLQLLDLYKSSFSLSDGIEIYVLAAVVAALTGFASLSLLKYMMVHAQFRWFGVYCLLLSGIVIATTLL